jgi:glycosyltransferase involved in cell wall biosynthesis
VILGDGPEHARIEAIAAGRADVEMRGTVPLGELRDILASSRIFANVPASDATSATLLDSLALGLIPVVSDLPAYREWIDHRVGEVVSANPTAAELADALDRAANRELNAVDVRRRVADVIWEDEVTRLVAAYAELTHD